MYSKKIYVLYSIDTKIFVPKMDNLVEKIEELPLSGDDLLVMAREFDIQDAKWMLYDDLRNYGDIRELFKDAHVIYILMQIHGDAGNSVGHWITLIFHEDRDIYYYFDPYGLSIAEDLKITHEESYIISLMSQIDYQENVIQHQKFRDETATCGRWCVFRSIFKHLDNNEFDHLVVKPALRYVKDGDVLVSLVTGLINQTDRVLISFFNKKEK